VSEKRRGLGRGLGALIPSAGTATRPVGERPVDVFFPERAAASNVATVTEPAMTQDAQPLPETHAPVGPGSEEGAEKSATDWDSASEAESVDEAAIHAHGETAEAGETADAGEGDAGLKEHVPAQARDESAHAHPEDWAPPADGQLREAMSDVESSWQAERAERAEQAEQAEQAEPGAWGDGAGPPPRTWESSEAASASEKELVPVPGATFAELPISSIVPNPKQPRQIFDDEELAELVESIREVGVLQPIVVRPAHVGEGGPQYEMVMGERRWRAARDAGLTAIPCIIRETGDDALLRDALLENLHRSQLNPLEEAAAYQQLLEDFACTHDELGQRIHRSRPQISNTIRLLKLPPLVQRRVAAGVLSAGHARAVLGLGDVEAMDRLAQRIVSEGLSVRAVEEIVALGDEPAKPRAKRPRAGTHHSELDDLASRLGDRWDTRVSISLGRAKGRLTVEFASVEDLNRLIAVMVPEDRGAFHEG